MGQQLRGKTERPIEFICREVGGSSPLWSTKILYLQKKLEENILALAAKNKEIKRLKEEIDKSKNLRDVSKLEEENRNLKSLNERDQKEINQLLEQIFDLQTNLSKQNEEIRVLTEENKKLKSM